MKIHLKSKGLLPLLLGSMFLIVGIVLLSQAIAKDQFEKTALKSTGRIVSHHIAYDRPLGIPIDFNERYEPVISFKDNNGAEIRFSSKLGDFSSSGKHRCRVDTCIRTLKESQTNYPLGSEYVIFYSPENHQIAKAIDPKLQDSELKLNSPFLWIFVTFGLIGGGTVFLAGLYTLLRKS